MSENWRGWLLNALLAAFMAMAGGWGLAVRQDMADIKVAVQGLTAIVSGVATDNAVLKYRVDQVERARYP